MTKLINKLKWFLFGRPLPDEYELKKIQFYGNIKAEIDKILYDWLIEQYDNLT